MRRCPLLLLFGVLALAGCSSSTSPESTTVEADLSASPSSGTVITDFSFDAGGSSSSNRSLEFRWDWDSDGTYDTEWSADPTETRRFTAGDTITVTVEVSDGEDSETATATLLLNDDHGAIVGEITLPPIESGTDFAAITTDGTDFWASTWLGDIYKLDGVTCAKIDSMNGMTNWTGAAAWDGEYLWVMDNNWFRKRDTGDGSTLFSFPVTYSAYSGGAAWDGEKFFIGSDESGSRDGDGLIHTYTPDGTETGTIPTPGGSDSPWGLAHDGENLWVVIQQGDTLYSLNPDDGSVRWTVPYEVEHHDLTVRDGYLWVITYDGPRTLRKIVP